LFLPSPTWIPNRKAARLLPGQAESLRRLTRDDAKQQACLAQVNRLIAEKMRELDETIRARQTQGFDAASRIVLNNAGKKIMHRRKGGEGGCSRLCR